MGIEMRLRNIARSGERCVLLERTDGGGRN